MRRFEITQTPRRDLWLMLMKAGLTEPLETSRWDGGRVISADMIHCVEETVKVISDRSCSWRAFILIWQRSGPGYLLNQ